VLGVMFYRLNATAWGEGARTARGFPSVT
jgi:hypothetical protein